MKILALLTVFIICVKGETFTQNISPNDIEKKINIKNQSAKMGRAFLAGDFVQFASFTYPQILRSVGGESKMVAILKKTITDMKKNGMSFKNITFGEPSAIVKSKNELQSTILQHTTISLSQGSILSTSTLIAISINKGINWTFIDTSNKDMATLRKALPNLSPLIIIPSQKPPVRLN